MFSFYFKYNFDIKKISWPLTYSQPRLGILLSSIAPACKCEFVSLIPGTKIYIYNLYDSISLHRDKVWRIIVPISWDWCGIK